MLDGIWDSDYVCRLGLLDHCRELLVIDERIKSEKNGRVEYIDYERVKALEKHFRMECCDLLLIFLKYMSVPFDIGSIEGHLLAERHEKFLEKAREGNNNYMRRKHD